MKKIGKIILKLILFLAIFINLICSYFKIANFLMYLIDVLLIIGFIISCASKTKKNKIERFYLISVFLFLVFTLLSFIISPGSLISYLLQVRIYFRFYLFVFCAMRTFDLNDVAKIGNAMIFLLIPNLVFIVFQYLDGLWVDEIGGIFGTSYGYSNTCQGGYLLVCSIILFSKIINEKKKLLNFIFILITLLSASLCEIKVFYLQFLILFIFYIFSSKFSIKKLLFVSVGGLSIITAISLFYVFNKHVQAGFFSVDGIVSYINGGYASTLNGINRVNGFQIINTHIFGNDFIKKMFGIGFGNAKQSASSLFYSQYGWLNYDFFMYSYLYLEVGIIGLILYLIPILIPFVISLKSHNKYTFISKCITFFAIISMFYNQSLITDGCGYLIYLMISLPLICKKGEGLYGKNY